MDGVQRTRAVAAAATLIRVRLRERPTGEQFWCDLRHALVDLEDAACLDAAALERARRALARADREARSLHEGEVSQLAECLLLALEHLAAGRDAEAEALLDAIHAGNVASPVETREGAAS